MRIPDIFRRNTKTPDNSSEPKIEFGFRGEGITYHLQGKSVEVWYTWLYGSRVYTENLLKWKDGSGLTDDEKMQIMGDIVRFIGQKHEAPTIVINRDDPFGVFWEQFSSTHKSIVKTVEYTSRAAQNDSMRKMYLDFIRAGKAVTLDGVEISSEQDLDKALKKTGKG
jgi:hypothetical protein